MADNTKPVTAVELKTFIDAVEFAADAEKWVPSERQWTRIRDMINRLEETASAPAAMAQAPQQHYMQIPTADAQISYGPRGMGPPGGGMMQPQGLPQGVPFAAATPQIPVKTPDIDTLGKPYTSAFA